MQDKYAGDVGDFGKFVLLRRLCEIGGSGIRIGLNWYRCEPEEKNNTDGRHIEYLFPDSKLFDSFRRCDEHVHERLRNLVRSGARSVRALERGNMLPRNVIYFSELLSHYGGSTMQRSEQRARWFTQSLEALRRTDIVLLDPDNGIQPLSAKKTERRAVKYAFDDEIERYYTEGKSIIVYQHRDRSPLSRYHARLRRIFNCAGSEAWSAVLTHKRYSVRDYVILSQPKHRKIFEALVTILNTEPISFLFEKRSPL